jgi:antitoxin PrlF
MRVTDKGQVTIPKHIREQAGLRAGTEVAFRFEDGVVIMEQVRKNPDDAEARRRRFEDALEHLNRLRGIANSGLSPDEIMEMTRGPYDDVDPG